MVVQIKKRRLSAYYTYWRSGQPIIVSIRKQPTPVNALRHTANVNACASPSHDNSCNGPDSSQRTELALKICIQRYRFFFTLQPDVGISFYSSFLSSWKMNIRTMMIKGKSQPHVPPSWYPGISQGRPRSEISANTGNVPPNKRTSKIYFFIAVVFVSFISLSPILP